MAIELFYSSGFQAVGVDQILTAAGVTKTLIAVRAGKEDIREALGGSVAVLGGPQALEQVTAEADAYATGIIAEAINRNGLEAAQYQVAMRQVDSLNNLGTGEGKQTIVLPASALEAFGDAFKFFRGRT